MKNILIAIGSLVILILLDITLLFTALSINSGGLFLMGVLIMISCIPATITCILAVLTVWYLKGRWFEN